MRINLKNAVSFNINYEIYVGGKVENGINPDKFKKGDRGLMKKAHIVVDFGNFERILWFESETVMENFIEQYLPQEIEDVIMTEE